MLSTYTVNFCVQRWYALFNATHYIMFFWHSVIFSKKFFHLKFYHTGAHFLFQQHTSFFAQNPLRNSFSGSAHAIQCPTLGMYVIETFWYFTLTHAEEILRELTNQLVPTLALTFCSKFLSHAPPLLMFSTLSFFVFVFYTFLLLFFFFLLFILLVSVVSVLLY